MTNQTELGEIQSENKSCGWYQVSALDKFSAAYAPIHVPLSLGICICGIIANIVNVMVLSHSTMRSSSNLLLAALSIGEGTVMAIYTFYAIVFRMLARFEKGLPRAYAYTLLGYLFAQNLVHTFSTWMIVFLAAFRLIFMRAGVSSTSICSFSRARKIILADCILSAVLAIPFLLAHQVKPLSEAASLSDEPSGVDVSNQNINAYEIDFVLNPVLRALLFLTSAIFIKALPIVLMTAFSAALIHTIRVSEKRRNRLLYERKESSEGMTKDTTPTSLTSAKQRVTGAESGTRTKHQITNILFALIILYIITYLPQVSPREGMPFFPEV
ncbi:unnamed protein product [Schistocephalus solidus]|uniref:G_PROTEIN_RECEP_F1_2 domain-containing protein n=1 Tax=Schistocephalus solidus TaxID=70667 RepID=A0A183T1Q0_SCHSO|nr:unnamed protein product [Schistocephalus solidus]